MRKFLELDQYLPKGFKCTRDLRNQSHVQDLTQVIPSKESKFYISSRDRLLNKLFFGLLLTLVLLVFVGRAYTMQIILKDKYLANAEANRTRASIIQPERGVIFDIDQKPLVRNKPAFDIELNTHVCGNSCAEVISRLNSKMGLDISPLDLLKDKKPIVIVGSNLTKEKLIPVESNLNEFPGLVVNTQPVRDYVLEEAFSHVLGYVGLDDKTFQPKYVGKSGIEKAYQDYLYGIPGKKIVRVDSEGGNYRVIAQQNALPGKNITTFLNTALQTKAYELIKQKVESGDAVGGAVVAQDTRTGGIVALASYPGFNPNKMSYGLTQKELDDLVKPGNFPFFNRAVSAAYPPGSTFKMIPASAALSEGLITRYTTIFDPGYIQVGSFIFRNWKTDGHGEVNLVKALQVSNDTYFYTVGGGYRGVGGLGIEKLSSWAKKFGYGSITGIDIEGENPGYMPTGLDRDWYLGDTYITSIGQGDVLATPLQVNNVTTYFANGGSLLKPRVVKSIDGVGELKTTVLAQNLISQENHKLIVEGMKKAVLPGGTAYPLFDFSQRHKGIELAGKTGTSEYIDPSGKAKTHAWFTVFGPVSDISASGATAISLTVFLEGGGAGSDDASPIAKELLDIWFSTYQGNK